MRKGIEIREEINEKIKKKINEGNFLKEVKEFLNKILLLEFQHIDEERPRIRDEYEHYIRKYAKNWKGE